MIISYQKSTYKESLSLVISPFEANILIPRLRAKTLHSRLHMFAPRTYPGQNTLLFSEELNLPPTNTVHNPNNSSSPRGRTQSSASTSDNSTNLVHTQLCMFAGSMYFADEGEQSMYCRCAGVIPRPRTASEQRAFSNGWTVGQFVMAESRSQVDEQMHSLCPFRRDPSSLLTGILERRFELLHKQSHVARILIDGVKPLHKI